MTDNIDRMKPVIAGALGNPASTCAQSCEGNAYRIAIRRLREGYDDARRAATELALQNTKLTRERDALAAKLAELEGQEPNEISPEFTDSARAALLWVLWHHQGGSSPVGQPIRYALGMGAHEPMNEIQVQEAKRWAALAKSESHDFHKRYARPIPAEPVNARLLEALKSCVEHGAMTGAEWVVDKARDAIGAATLGVEAPKNGD